MSQCACFSNYKAYSLAGAVVLVGNRHLWKESFRCEELKNGCLCTILIKPIKIQTEDYLDDIIYIFKIYIWTSWIWISEVFTEVGRSRINSTTPRVSSNIMWRKYIICMVVSDVAINKDCLLPSPVSFGSPLRLVFLAAGKKHLSRFRKGASWVKEYNKGNGHESPLVLKE